MELTVKHFIDAGHILPDTEHLLSKGCSRLHGHTYAFIVKFQGKELQGGMLLDFKKIKEVIDRLDHRTLINRETHPGLHDALCNNPDQLVSFPYIPSSENISQYVAEQLLKEFPQIGAFEVSVCEGYKGEERANWTTVKLYRNE